MASEFLSLLSLLTLAGTSLAGVTTYSYNPYAAYHHVPAAVTTYASPAHQFVYHQAEPAVYHQAAPAVYHHASVVAKSYAAPAPIVAAAPVVKTFTAATPAAQVAAAAPIVDKTVVAPAAIVKQVEVESAPRYDFSYGVHDSLTGDIKNQVETRTGGNVAGSYSVVDADGYKRTVTYTADDLNGFNAVVQREPIVARSAFVAAPAVQQVVPAKPIAPVVQQQHLQYLPQQPIAVAQPVGQQPVQPVGQQPVQPAVEPVPVEYPEQQPEPEQQQPEQPQYPQEAHFPPYPNAEGDDSDVVDVRSAGDNNNAEVPSADSPAPVAEAVKEA